MKSELAVAVLGFATIATGFVVQPNTPGGQPSQQPRPANPQPRPSTPDGQRDTPPLERRSGQETPSPTPAQDRYVRPFTFVSPEYETRFMDNARRLDAAERRMAESNQQAIQRLGAIRQMPPDRQNAAVLDLLQQVLQERAALNQYLMEARTTWTGDLADGETARPGQPSNESQQGTTTSPQQPTTPPQQPQRPR